MSPVMTVIRQHQPTSEGNIYHAEPQLDWPPLIEVKKIFLGCVINTLAGREERVL